MKHRKFDYLYTVACNREKLTLAQKAAKSSGRSLPQLVRNLIERYAKREIVDARRIERLKKRSENENE